MPSFAPFANLAATLIAALLTGAFGFFTARLTANVQRHATSQNAQGGENERAWKRAEKSDTDADKWREAWSHEFELRVKRDAEIVVLSGRIAALEEEVKGRSEEAT